MRFGEFKSSYPHQSKMAPSRVPFLFWCSMRTRRHCAIFFHEGRTLSPLRGGVQVRTWRYAPRCLPRTTKEMAPPYAVSFLLLVWLIGSCADTEFFDFAQQAKWGNPLFAFPFIALTRLFGCDIIKAITQGGCDVCFWKWISDQRRLGKAHR